MEQRNNGNGTVTMWIDGERLRTMDAFSLDVYANGQRLYIADRPQWVDDSMVATVADLLDTVGYDDTDGLIADEVFELTVEVA